MSIFKGLFKAEMRMLIRNPFAVFFGIITPIVVMIMQAEMIEEAIPLQGLEVSVIDIALPMYAMFSLFVLGVGNAGLGLIHTRNINFFKRLRLTPATKKHYLLASMSVQFLVSILTIVVLFLVAIIMYSANMPLSVMPVFILILILCFFMSYSFGIFLGSVFINPKSVESIATSIYFGVLFLGGFMFPVEMMPDLMRRVANTIPTTHAVRLI